MHKRSLLLLFLFTLFPLFLNAQSKPKNQVNIFLDEIEKLEQYENPFKSEEEELTEEEMFETIQQEFKIQWHQPLHYAGSIHYRLYEDPILKLFAKAYYQFPESSRHIIQEKWPTIQFEELRGFWVDMIPLFRGSSFSFHKNTIVITYDSLRLPKSEDEIHRFLEEKLLKENPKLNEKNEEHTESKINLLFSYLKMPTSEEGSLELPFILFERTLKVLYGSRSESFESWEAGHPQTQVVLENAQTPGSIKPKNFTQKVVIAFSNPKGALQGVLLTRDYFLRTPISEYHMTLLFKDKENDFEGNLYFVVQSNTKQILQMCLNSRQCFGKKAVIAPKKEDPLSTHAQKPAFEPDGPKWVTTAFDEIMKEHWAGTLTSQCAVVVDSGIDYNHPLIRSHLPYTLDSSDPLPVTTPESLAPKAFTFTLEQFRQALLEKGLFTFNSSQPFSPKETKKEEWGLDLAFGGRLPYDMDKKGDIEGHGTLVSSILFSGTQHLFIKAVKIPLDIAYNNEKLIAVHSRWGEFIQASGCRIANFSWGANGMILSESKAIIDNILRNPNTLFFEAAGNGYSAFGLLWIGRNDSKDHPHYPSGIAIPNTVSVGSIDVDSDTTSSFSPEDKHLIDLQAYGSGLIGAKAGKHEGEEAFEKWGVSGTSFSSPWAANVAAKVLMIAPQLLTGEVKDILLSSIDNDKILDPKSALIAACKTQPVDQKGCIEAIESTSIEVLGGPLDSYEYFTEDEVGVIAQSQGAYTDFSLAFYNYLSNPLNEEHKTKFTTLFLKLRPTIRENFLNGILKNWDSSPPLSKAIQHRNIELIKFLLENGANPNLPEIIIGEKKDNPCYERPLAYLVTYSNSFSSKEETILDLLFQHGASGNFKGCALLCKAIDDHLPAKIILKLIQTQPDMNHPHN